MLVVNTPEQAQDFARQMAPLADYDIGQRLEKIAARPLLVWHGEADDVVPVAESVRLERALREAKLDAGLTFITEQGIGLSLIHI